MLLEGNTMGLTGQRYTSLTKYVKYTMPPCLSNILKMVVKCFSQMYRSQTAYYLKLSVANLCGDNFKRDTHF